MLRASGIRAPGLGLGLVLMLRTSEIRASGLWVWGYGSGALGLGLCAFWALWLLGFVAFFGLVALLGLWLWVWGFGSGALGLRSLEPGACGCSLDKTSNQPTGQSGAGACRQDSIKIRAYSSFCEIFFICYN